MRKFFYTLALIMSIAIFSSSSMAKPTKISGTVNLNVVP